MLRLEIHTDGAAIYPTDNEVVNQTLADRQAFFESDQVVVLVTAREDGPLVSSRQGLVFLKHLHEVLAAVPGVYARRVRSLATLIDPQPGIPVLQSPDFLDEIPQDDAAFGRLRARIAASPLGHGLFLSEAGTAAAIYAPVWREASRDQLVSGVEAALVEQSGAFELRMTGPVAAEVTLGRAVLLDLARLVPVMVALMTVLLFACLRSPAGVVVTMAEVGMVLVCTLGAMGHLGVPVTLVTTILPVLLMAVAVTDEIHLLERFRAHVAAEGTAPGMGPESRRIAIEQALRDVARPIVLTSLTTSIGFLSFLTATVEPVRDFGLFTAVGVLLAMGLSFTFIPALVIVLPGGWFREFGGGAPAGDGAATARAPNLLERGISRHRGLAAGSGVLMLLVAVPGLSQLSVQDAWVENFDPGADVVTAEGDFNAHFWGTYRFDIVLEGEEPLFFFREPGLRLIDQLAAVAKLGPHVGGAAHAVIAYQIVADVWEEPGQVFDLPEERIAEMTRLLSYVSARTDLDQLLNPNGSRARLRLFVNGATYQRGNELRAYLERALPPVLAASGSNVRFRFSGDLPLAQAVVGDIVTNMLRSVGWTSLGVGVLLLLFLRSVVAAGIAFVPLVCGIPVLLGAMGYLDVPLGIATSMFAAVAIGVAVDFSVHFTHAYRVQRDRGADHDDALRGTLTSAGRAIRWNALVLALGLLVLAVSGLKPNRSLGLLLSATMMTCYAMTLLLLPSLLRHAPDRRGVPCEPGKR